jgi:hypothetical protein
VRGRLGYSGGEVGEAGARVNGEATGWAVVGGEHAGEGMGRTKDLTSGPGLPAGERSEREREGAADRWGRAVRRGMGTRSWAAWAVGEEGGERAWARFGPDTAQPRVGRVFPFSFSVFYFTFPFSIFVSFYFLFF